MLYNRYEIVKHGYVFKINQTRFGHLITLNGKWIWRSKTKTDAVQICNQYALKELLK